MYEYSYIYYTNYYRFTFIIINKINSLRFIYIHIHLFGLTSVLSLILVECVDMKFSLCYDVQITLDSILSADFECAYILMKLIFKTLYLDVLS